VSAAYQLEIEALYNLQFESAASVFDLRDVLTYLAQRVGLIPGLVWLGAGNAVNVSLTAKQRRNLLRFLHRHGLKWYMLLDDFHKRQPGARKSSRESGLSPVDRGGAQGSDNQLCIKLHNPAIAKEDVGGMYEQLVGVMVRAATPTNRPQELPVPERVMSQTGHRRADMVRRHIRNGSMFQEKAAANGGL
jgi:hypothetical protein